VRICTTRRGQHESQQQKVQKRGPCPALRPVCVALLGVIGDLGMKSIVTDEIATATGSLRTLHLRGCHLKSEALEALGIGLSSCLTITELW
jgi:hypothetical protein